MKNKIKFRIVAFALAFVFCPMVFAYALSPDVQVSLLKYSPYPAEPGDYLTLTFKVENSGTAVANNVRLKFYPSYPFSLEKNATMYLLNSAESVQLGSDGVATLGNLPLSQYTIVEYKVRVDGDVLEGNNPIDLWYQADSGEIWNRKTFNIFVQGTDRLEVSSVEPSILTPGNPTDAVFVLNNTGTASIRDISFMWADMEGEILPLGSGNTKYVDSIAAGESASIHFTLVADPGATIGAYTLNANISYVIGAGINKTQSVRIGVFIGGKGKFDVSMLDSSSGSVSLSIANIGETTTSSVSVSIPEQESYSVSVPTSSFIGNMDPGDFITATFEISQRGFGNRSMPSNPLKVDITYTDTNGNRETIRKEVTISTQTTMESAIAAVSESSGIPGNFQRRNNGLLGIPGTGQSSGSMLIVIGVGVIFLAIILFILRKRIMGFFQKYRKTK